MTKRHGVQGDGGQESGHQTDSQAMPLAVILAPERFHLLRPIGQGGMGRIHLALDHQLGRRVALKFPRPSQASQNIRLLLEARYQAAIRHPNVVPVYEVGILHDNPCIVMAFIDGPNLWEARKVLPLEELARLVAQAAHGVHAAHCSGLIHQDLKPENILVDRPEEGLWRAYVADFGLARQEDDPTAGGEETASSLPAGTLGYMSPEQLAGGLALDPRSDVYSLGAILYALTTGRPPLDLEGASRAPGTGTEPRILSRAGLDTSELLQRIQEAPRPPRSLNQGVPPDLETIILHALELEPHRRYPSAQELAEDLDRFLAGEPIRARRPTWSYRLGRFVARNRALAGLAAVVMLGLLLAPGALFYLAHRIRERTLLAQRYAMYSQQIEQHLRLGHMLAPHDRTPQVRWALERMEELRSVAAREGAIAQGPFAFLAGTTDLIMDRPQRAQAELERAWNLGYRTPTVAQALGEAVMEARLLDTVAPGPGQSLGPEGSRALDFLKQARLPGTFTPILEARIAQIEGRTEDAITLCRQALAQTPWAYEAHIQIGEVRLNSMHRAEGFQELETLFAQAMGDFDAAIALAPSDPKPVLFKAYAIRQMERRRVEIGLGLNQGRLRSAIRLCDLAERLDPGLARVFGERSLLRCVLVSHADGSWPDLSLEVEKAAMLADAQRAHALDPALEIAQAALAWALQAQGGDAFRRRSSSCEQENDRCEATLRALLEQHPRSAALHKALAYTLWTRVDLQQEAGQDPRPALRDLLAHLRTSMELQSQRLWFMGEQVPDAYELAERLTYLAEAEHAWGDAAASGTALTEGRSTLDRMGGKAGMMISLPYLRAWNRLLEAQLLLEAGQDPAMALGEAAKAVAGAAPGGLEKSYNRIPRALPRQAQLLEAQRCLRRGEDPRPLWGACVREARKDLLRSPGDPYPLYGWLQASIQDVRYRLARGMDASDPGRACAEGARRLGALEARRWPTEPRTRLADFGRLHADLARPGAQRGSVLGAIHALEEGHPVFAGALFQDPAWVEWGTKHHANPPLFLRP